MEQKYEVALIFRPNYVSWIYAIYVFWGNASCIQVTSPMSLTASLVTTKREHPTVILFVWYPWRFCVHILVQLSFCWKYNYYYSNYSPQRQSDWAKYSTNAQDTQCFISYFVFQQTRGQRRPHGSILYLIHGLGVTQPNFSVLLFSHFPALWIHTLAIEYPSYALYVSLHLHCCDTC